MVSRRPMPWERLWPWPAAPLGLVALAVAVLAVPRRWEGPVLLPISPGHALVVLDAVALLPLVLGNGWLYGGLWVRRRRLERSPAEPAPPRYANIVGGRTAAAGQVASRQVARRGDRGASNRRTSDPPVSASSACIVPAGVRVGPPPQRPQTDTMVLLSAVTGRRSQPAHRSFKRSPAMRAIRSISLGHA